jgi:hypothetical protein
MAGEGASIKAKIAFEFEPRSNRVIGVQRREKPIYYSMVLVRGSFDFPNIALDNRQSAGV